MPRVRQQTLVPWHLRLYCLGVQTSDEEFCCGAFVPSTSCELSGCEGTLPARCFGMQCSSGAASDETEIAKLRETLHRCQADLAHAELEAEAAEAAASAPPLSELTEAMPSSSGAAGRRGPRPALGLDEPGRGEGSRPPRAGALEALEDIIEAVKQHDLKMTAIKSELTRREEKGNATPDEATVVELQTRRNELEESTYT